MNFGFPPRYPKILVFVAGFSMLVNLGSSNAQGVSSHLLSLPSRQVASADGTNPPPGSYTGLFYPTAIYDSGGQAASAFLLADVNGDGKTDIVILNNLASQPNGDSQIAILLGNGDGTFQPPMVFDAGSTADTLATGDVNGDGKLDLIVGSSGYNGSVNLLLGNGDGTFRPAVVYSIGYSSGTIAVAIGDLNGDGLDDVFAVTGDAFSVLLGNADGALQPAMTVGGSKSELNALALADLNRDGKLDAIMLSCDPSCNGDVWLGSGDGTFVNYTQIGFDGNALPTPLSVVDVNGDGIPDLVFGNGTAVSVALGKGDGSFNSEQTYSVLDPYNWPGGDASSMVVTDLNHDGWPDIAVVNGSLTVLLNNGDGTFHRAFSYVPLLRSDATVVKSADFNRDGKPDLILLEPNGGGGNDVSVVEALLGNGDGTFSGGDLVFDAGGSVAADMATADINADGRPDVLVLNFCTNLFNCPLSGSEDGSLGVLLNNKNFFFSKTTTSLTSSPNPSVYGQEISFAARVTAGAVTSKSGTATGTVYFFQPEDSDPFASANLVNGVATLKTAAVPAGTIPITAQYQGSANFGGSLASPLNQIVQQATTATTVVSSRNPAKVGQTIEYSALVQGQYGGQVSGYYVIMDGGDVIGEVTFGGKRTVVKATYSTPGTHVITASYTGDPDNLPSMSAQFLEQVKAPTSTQLGTSGSPSHSGQPVTFTAVITSAYGTIPDGEAVTFYDGSKILGTQVTSGGEAMLTTSSLNVKTQTIKAFYLGDVVFEASEGKTFQVVQP